MARLGPSPFSFPEFRGVTRQLVLVNLGTFFAWFLASFLESSHGESWVMGLYGSAVVGTALSAAVLYFATDKLGHPIEQMPLYGCMGGIFGLLIAIGILYGDMEFLLFFTIGIKARYMAAIYALIA